MEYIHFETLNVLCEKLARETYNDTNLTTTEPLSSETTVTVSNGDNKTWAPNATTTVPAWMLDVEASTTNEVEVVLHQIETTTEQLVIPIIAYVGIAINILVCFLLKSDQDMRISSRTLIYSFLISQMLYLASVAIYLKFKQLLFASDITMMNYVTIAISMFQMLATWILFLLISESYRNIKCFMKKTKVLSIWNNLAKLAMLILLVLIYHLPYVPQIRVILYQLDKGFFSPCSNSIDDHWEFILPKKTDPVDNYYVIYFCVMYIIVTYALPYLLIGCQDKDVIDLLHWVKDDTTLSTDVYAPAHTAFLSTVFCNTYLIFYIPKVVSMIFYLFNQPLRYLNDRFRYFYFMNAFGNLAIVLWPITNLYILLRYNEKVRGHMTIMCVTRGRKLTWPLRKRLYMQKKRQTMQCVCKSDEEIEIANLAEAEQC